MADQKRNWRQFQKLSFDSKRLSKRVKKAEGATIRHAHKFIIKRLDSIRSVRRHIIGWLVGVSALLVMVMLQMMWFQQSYRTTAAAAGGTYAEAALGSIDTLNPLYASSSAEMSASNLLFSSLYDYDKTGTLQGDIAERMSVSKDERVYTVDLTRAGLWHDGTKLTAKDVVFTVNLIKSPGALSPLRSTWRDIKAEAVNDYTVRFTLPAPYAAFSHALTFAILPEHLLHDVAPESIRENTFSRSPVGSGPFQFRLLQTVNAAKGQKVLNLTAFSEYHKGAPLLGRFEIHSYTSQDDIVKALQLGEVNASADLSSANRERLDVNAYTYQTKSIHSGVYALFNTSAPLLEKRAVRQALQLATDRSAVRDSVDRNAPLLQGPFVEGQLKGKPLKLPEFNLEKARAILEKDGYKRNSEGIFHKKDKPLSLRVVTVKNQEFERALATLVGQWRTLGVEVTTEVIDANDQSANFTQNVLQPRNYDVLVTELTIGADPDVYAYWHSSQAGMTGRNFSNYASSNADLQLTSALSLINPELRNVKYRSFAEQWVRDAPAVGLYQSVIGYVANKRLVTLPADEKLISPYDRYSQVIYWSVAKKPVYKTP